jgi:signal transduction histidine kinase
MDLIIPNAIIGPVLRLCKYLECPPGGLVPAWVRRFVAVATLGIGLGPSPLLAMPSIFFESDPLQQKIDGIRALHDSLPASLTHPAPWNFGYAASWEDDPADPVRIEIKFLKAEVVDLVAILPATHVDLANVKQSFGFPVRFSLERLLPDGSVEMIANYLDEDYPEPGVGPQLFRCSNPVPTSGLRITVTQRSRNASWWQTSHVLALTEVFAFADEQNVALHGQVKTSSSFDLAEVWSPAYLTDGFTLYSPTKLHVRDPTLVFRVFADSASLEIDLGHEQLIDEFRLWPVVVGPQFNLPLSVGVGFPKAFKVELSRDPDFSDSKLIYAEKHLAQKPGGGPYMRRVEPTMGRYVRISLADGDRVAPSRIELGEIELLGNGRVISTRLPVRIESGESAVEGLDLLTDGLVSEGEILPQREWLTRFHQRALLMQELRNLWPVATEARVRDGKRMMTMLFVGVGVILTLAQLIWVVRVSAHRRWARMRERIACDLHDEIGANVSSIAHTAELLKETIREPSETQSRLLLNLIDSAHLTTRETKHFVRFIENEEQDRDLTEQFVQVANRILGTIPARFSLENTRGFNALDPSAKWNLLLFYKEALNNIIKHSRATAVDIQTRRIGTSLCLHIADNGVGISAESPFCRHLESRAKVLGGQLDIRSRLAEGTHVILTFDRH